MKFIDLSGQRFGRLVVVKRAENGKGKARFECLCDCGNPSFVDSNKLKNGHTKSCGCYGRSIAVTHGMYNTAEYRVWAQMIQRCTNPKTNGFENYGAKGVTVCEEWRSFETFFADMGPRPSPKHTVERVDGGKGYSKENCKWATYAEQNRNTARNRNITFLGHTLCLTDWAEIANIERAALDSRLRKGWSVERALTT